MNKYSNQSKEKKIIEPTKINEDEGKYYIQTSSFKKISKSKKHIIFLKNKIKILRSYQHIIKKRGSYFISLIYVNNKKVAINLCNEIEPE